MPLLTFIIWFVAIFIHLKNPSSILGMISLAVLIGASIFWAARTLKKLGSPKEQWTYKFSSIMFIMFFGLLILSPIINTEGLYIKILSIVLSFLFTLSYMYLVFLASFHLSNCPNNGNSVVKFLISLLSFSFVFAGSFYINKNIDKRLRLM